MTTDLTPAHRAAVEVMAKAMRQNVTAEPIPESTLASAVVRSAATAALRALVEAGFWIARWEPIETAPKDGTEVVTAGSRSYGQEVSTDWYAVDPMSTELGWLIGTTHWTPLPPPPPEADDAK